MPLFSSSRLISMSLSLFLSSFPLFPLFQGVAPWVPSPRYRTRLNWAELWHWWLLRLLLLRNSLGITWQVVRNSIIYHFFVYIYDYFQLYFSPIKLSLSQPTNSTFFLFFPHPPEGAWANCCVCWSICGHNL